VSDADHHVPGRSRLVRLVARLLLIAPALVLAVLLVAELAVRGVYTWALHRRDEFPLVFETVYWPVPPWIGFTSILAAEPEVGLWTRPDVQRTYINLFGPIENLDEVDALFTQLVPDIPPWVRARGVWHFRTNAAGVRNDEIAAEKPADTFRVVVLGDSWTVGVNVDEPQTFPRRLEDGLRRTFPDRRVEVINYGAIGATSHTGQRLLPRIIGLDPDLVVVAYAQNDEAAVRDGAPEIAQPSGTTQPLAARILAASELHKLYAYLRTRQPGQIQPLIKESAMRAPGPAENEPRRLCAAGGADQGRYQQRIDGIVQALLARGTAVVLVYNNIPEYVSNCTLTALQHVARTRALPLVDTSALLAARGATLQAGIDATLGLVTPPPQRRPPANTATVVFRVDMSTAPAGRRPSIMGSGPALATFTPNRLELYDDGAHGDQAAGDGVWSRAVDIEKPGKLSYLYTDGERPGEWRGLESYRPRSFALRELGVTVYTPVAQFGRRLLRSDVAHPDAEGYALIADAVLDVIVNDASLSDRLDGHAPGRQR
jgi:lysophospholipase L1-like esterase